MIPVVALFVLVCLLPWNAHSATCNQTPHSLAHWLCRDTMLNAADAHLTLAYKRLEQLLTAKQTPRLQQSQQRWQQKRAQCLQQKQTRRCLLKRYDRRTLWLNRRIAMLEFRRSTAYAKAPTTAVSGVYKHAQWHLRVKPLSTSRLLLTLRGDCALRREATLTAQNQVTLYRHSVPQGVVLQFDAQQVSAPRLGLQRLCPTWRSAAQEVVLRKAKE